MSTVGTSDGVSHHLVEIIVGTVVGEGVQELWRRFFFSLAFSSNCRSCNLDAIILGALRDIVGNKICFFVWNRQTTENNVVVRSFVSDIVNTLKGRGGLRKPGVDVADFLPLQISFWRSKLVFASLSQLKAVHVRRSIV